MRDVIVTRIHVGRGQILDGVDRETEKCVNGPRVTNMIYRLVRTVQWLARPSILSGELWHTYVVANV